jgi:hypothetical protein
MCRPMLFPGGRSWDLKIRGITKFRHFIPISAKGTHTTYSAPDRHVTVGQCCLQVDGAEIWKYEGLPNFGTLSQSQRKERTQLTVRLAVTWLSANAVSRWTELRSENTRDYQISALYPNLSHFLDLFTAHMRKHLGNELLHPHHLHPLPPQIL